MAKDNPRWGFVRVRGELLKLGYRVSATAIRKLLRRNRIGPAPLRSRHTWKAFIYGAGDEAGALVRGDRPPRRCLGDPASQECQLGAEPARCARAVLDPRSRLQVRGWLRPCVLGGNGMAVITTPIAAPRANSHMERQIGSTRRECIDWLLILNRRH